MSLPFEPALGDAILILSEVTIFLVIILDLTLLKPQRYRFTIWISPIISLYVLGAILFTMFVALAAFSPSALVSYAAVIVSSLIGLVLGTEIGNGIPLSGKTDGSKWYIGGTVLVVILLVLLLPRALEQAALLVTTFYQSGTVVSVLAGSSIIQALDAFTGSLVFFAVFMSIGWRYRVYRRQAQYAANFAGAENLPLDPSLLWKGLITMIRPDQATVLYSKMRSMSSVELFGMLLILGALVVAMIAAVLNIAGSGVPPLLTLILLLIIFGLLLFFVALSNDEDRFVLAKQMAMEQHPEFFTQAGQLSDQGMAYIASLQGQPQG